jgi:2-keto-3-deoxy-6-phosphogluconate aldolase
MVTKSDWIQAFEKGIQAIKFYGGADVGMRTMLDALIPALDQLKIGN